MYRLIITTAALLAAAHLPAAVLTVGNAGGCDHASVQAALDAASTGDEIRVRTDTYDEVIFIGKSVRIVGGFVNCTDANPTLFQKATLSAPAASNAPVINITPNVQVDLLRLILTGADHAGNGGGLLIGSSSNVGIELTEFVNNNAQSGGGAYVAQSATLRTLGPFGASISGNTASLGGGIYVRSGSGSTLDFATDAATTVTISNNVANNGGGIYHGGAGTIRLANTVIAGNHANTTGGGINSGPATSDALIRLTNCTVENNTAPNGGGLRLSGNLGSNKVLEFVGGALQGNAVSSNGGGAFLSGDVTTAFDGALVAGNQAGANGGAIYFNSNGGTLLIRSSEFSGNSAGADGGALWLNNVGFDATALLSPTVFRENSAGRNGGAVRQFGAAASLGGSLGAHPVRFVDNEAERGGAIHINNGQLTLAYPLEFLANRALVDGGAIHATAGSKVLSDGYGSPTERIVLNENLAGEAESITGLGGAIYLDGAELEAAWMLIGGSVDFGTTYSNGAYKAGGGLAVVNGAQARLYNSVVMGNAASEIGAGIAVLADGAQPSGLYFGAVYQDDDGNPDLGIPVAPCALQDLAADRYCAAFEHNGAIVGSAAVAHGAVSQARMEIDRAAIRDNGSAAILAYRGSEVKLRNVLVSGNANDALAASGASPPGSGSPGEALLTVDHATVTGNGLRTIRLLSAGGAATIQFHRSILWGNDEGMVNEGGSIESSCNITQSAGINGLMLDPLLAASDRGPYRLHFNSPAIDLCFESPEVSDLDGAPRPQDLRFDAGAFEGVAFGDRIFADDFEAD